MNLWAYVDADDAGEACRLAVEAELPGHHRMIVAATDSLMDVPSAQLMAEYFPGVRLNAVPGTGSLLSSGTARRLIGYAPKFSWRDRVGA